MNPQHRSPFDKLLFLTREEPAVSEQAQRLLAALDKPMLRDQWFAAAQVEQTNLFESPLTSRAIAMLCMSGCVEKKHTPHGNFFVRLDVGMAR
jgi:hypothetical protein